MKLLPCRRDVWRRVGTGQVQSKQWRKVRLDRILVEYFLRQVRKTVQYQYQYR